MVLAEFYKTNFKEVRSKLAVCTVTMILHLKKKMNLIRIYRH